MITSQSFISAYRLLNPLSRVISIFRYCRNTSSVKQRECIICGYKTDTWCAEYPRTKCTISEESEHIRMHLRKANKNRNLSSVEQIILEIGN